MSARRVREAVRALAKPRWLHPIVENVYWASCEALVQSALLYELNRSATGTVAGRERELARGWKPDLVFVGQADVGSWFDGSAAERAGLARGVYEAKLAWTKPCGKGNASLGRKAKELRAQRQLLREFDRVRPGVPRGLVLGLAGGAASPARLAADLEEAASILEEELALARGSLARARAVTVLGGVRDHGRARAFVELRLLLLPVD